MDRQLNFFEPVFSEDPAASFQQKLEPLLTQILEANGISRKRLCFNQNKGYYSITFRGSVVLSYNFAKKVSWIAIPKAYFSQNYANIGESQKEINGNMRITFSKPEDMFLHLQHFADVLDKAIDVSPKSFDCCSRYVECSDAKKCINPNADLALECAYRINLKHGRIFYGKNASRHNNNYS